MVFALFNVVWSTLFLEEWKRRGAELAYKWGTLDSPGEAVEEPRPQFRVSPRLREGQEEAELGGWLLQLGRGLDWWRETGECLAGALEGFNLVAVPPQGVRRISPVTRAEEFYYPAWKRLLFQLLVSLPLCLSCLACVFLLMLGCFQLQVTDPARDPQLQRAPLTSPCTLLHQRPAHPEDPVPWAWVTLVHPAGAGAEREGAAAARALPAQGGAGPAGERERRGLQEAGRVAQRHG